MSTDKPLTAEEIVKRVAVYLPNNTRDMLLEAIASAIRQRDEEISRLTQERDEAHKNMGNRVVDAEYNRNSAESWMARAEAAEARVAVLEAALKPFAETPYANVSGISTDDGKLYGICEGVTVADLRRARQALEPKP